MRFNPAALMVASYLGAMTIGGIVLMMPWAPHSAGISLIDALFIETNPIPVKTALGMMGKIDPELRLPL